MLAGNYSTIPYFQVNSRIGVSTVSSLCGYKAYTKYLSQGSSDTWYLMLVSDSVEYSLGLQYLFVSC